MELTDEERETLRKFLEERFNLAELKNLAYDMGIWYEGFTHNTLSDFSREFLAFCIRRGWESCLLDKLKQLRSDRHDWLVTLSAKIPPCNSEQKVQIIIGETLLPPMQLALDDLARQLSIPSESITVIAAAWGSMRLLLSLPTTALTPEYKRITTLVNGRYPILSIEAYIFLPATAQETWRQIGTMYPPMLKDGFLYATVGWQMVYETVKPAAETAVSPTASSSDHWLAEAENQAHLLSMSRDLVGKLAPGEISRLEDLFPQYTELAQVGQVTTVQQAQTAFGLSGTVDSMVLVLLPVLFTALNAWIGQRNRQTLTELRLQQGADRELLYQLLDDALKKNHVVRSERERLRPYMAETIAKEIGDTFSTYELGLRKLAEQVGPMSALLTYEQQLRENISQTRRHGDTRERASRRSEIIEQLNRFSLQEINQTFNDLCEIDGANREMWPESAENKPAVTAEEKETQQKDRPEKNRFAQRWSALRRLFTRKPPTKPAELGYVSVEQSAFIESIAQLIVTQVAPEELPVFEKLTAIYFADPTPPDLAAGPQYNPLSMGLGEVLVAITPAATAVVVFALTYLSRQRPISASEWEAQQEALKQTYNYEAGLRQLLNRIPPQHPRYSELLVFQTRLTENLEQQRIYEDTAELRHNRFKIIEQLNHLALDVLGESFIALSGMVEGVDPAKWQELRQQGFQVAQEFGMTEEVAEQITHSMMSAFLAILWNDFNE